MSALDRQLMAAIGKLPADGKLPLSALARQCDATVSVVTSALEAMIAAGKLDRATLRPPASVGREALLALLAKGPVHSRTIAARKLRAVAEQLVEEGVAERCASPNATTNFKNMLRLVGNGHAGPVAGAVPATATSAAPGPAADTVGGGVARSTRCAAPADRPTGAELVARIEAEAHRRGVTPHAMVRTAVTMHAGTWLEQLREVRRPKAATIERVTAMIEGRPIPPGQGPTVSKDQLVSRAEREARGLPPSQRMKREEHALELQSQRREAVDQRLAASREAQVERAPGETLADAVRREADAAAARRGAARKSGGLGLAKHECATETLAQRIARCGREVEQDEGDSTTGMTRRRSFEPIPADRWRKLAGLAAELGKSRSETLIDVIDAGILCVTEDLREGER